MSSATTAVQEPPKKKRKKDKNQFWLVKVPVWVAEEWFDDRKYPNGSQLGELYVMPDDTNKTKKKSMKLEVTRPHPMTSTPNPHSGGLLDPSGNNKFESSLKQFDVPIPTQFKMEQRKDRERVNVKHGELKVMGKDRLLVFHDKAAFPVGSKVEALDNSRNNGIAMDSDDEDDDVDMNSKGAKGQNGKNGKKSSLSSTIKGYAKGEIKEINDDRTFTVEFTKTKKQRYNVPERDIRFQDPSEALRANRCKILSIVNAEIDVSPVWTPQYKEYLQIRSMKKSFQHTMQLKRKENIFKQTREERERAAAKEVEKNKMDDAVNAKSKNKSNVKKKRVKKVRKDDKLYENMIFAAFEKDSCLNQADFERKTGEPWNFLRPVVVRLCDRIKSAEKGRGFVLKDEFRLATDNAIETVPESADK